MTGPSAAPTSSASSRPSAAAFPPTRRHLGEPQYRDLARHDHPVRAQGRPGRHGRRRPGHRWARPSSRATPARCAASARRQGRSPASPAPPPTPSPCSSGWKPSSSAIPASSTRACVELAKDWRTDRYLRRLEAMMAVADKDASAASLTGTGDVLEPEDGVIAIGSGGNYALAAARALIDDRGPRRRGDRPPRDEDRRRDLRLHQRQRHRRDDLRCDDAPTYSPREIVSELDRFIVGQNDAKRAVAIALRNRWRRQQLARGAARGGAAQEHPDDRPDRRAARPRSRAAWPSSPRRRSSRSRRPSSPRSAMSAATSSRSSATWSRSPSTMTRERLRKEVAGQGRARRRGARARRAGRRRAPAPRPRAKFRRMLRDGELDDTRDRDRGQPTAGGADAELRDPRHARRRRWA